MSYRTLTEEQRRDIVRYRHAYIYGHRSKIP